MAVVGVSLGDHSIYIAVAKQGGVETIANDYTQRCTPSIVALGGRQRFMGVSAENQRNLNVKNTVSYFKNFLGRNFKEEYVQREAAKVGADVVEIENGKLGFKVQNMVYTPEQIMAMLFTKVKDIVRSDQNEEIGTCVVSVPVHFTETQRSAIKDSAKIAGLKVVLMNDTSALTLAYGKTKQDLPEDPAPPRFLVFIDCGSGSLQATMVAVSKEKATVLGSSSSINTGGKFFDMALQEHLIKLIEEKYKVQLRGNRKALNKLRTSVEKIKKQMSANSNKLPFQIDSLIEDIDVNVNIDRATFEQLIQPQLEEVRTTVQNLIQSTTVKKGQVHSVEMVGGSTRIPAIKTIVEQELGIPPSNSLNADEAVARGCGLQAAAISDKFLTKKFDIQEVVTNGIEAVYVHDGIQEKVLIYDEGDNGSDERTISIRANIPVSVALQYSETVDVDNKFITLYEIKGDEAKKADLELIFRINQDGMINMVKVQNMTKEAPKRRKTSDAGGDPTESQSSAAEAGCGLAFAATSLGGMPENVVAHCYREEARMVREDVEEICRQEAKNVLEEQLYKYRSAIVENSELIDEEETFKQIRDYFDQTETWLYEEGEDAPKQTYEDILRSFHEKMKVFELWRSKYSQIKAKEEEKRRFLEQQQPRLGPQGGRRVPHPTAPQGGSGGGRQIPVVYEGGAPYTTRTDPGGGGWRMPDPSMQGFTRPSSSPEHPSYPGHQAPRPSSAPGPEARPHQARRRDQWPREGGGFRRSPFFNDPLFGW